VTLVDTGFLVALLDRSDPWHPWAVSTVGQASGPWITCEACIAETLHCLRGKAARARTRLFDWMERDLLQSRDALPERRGLVFSEINRYRGRDVDFADACLVILSDQLPRLPLVTTDARDFAVYMRGRSARTIFAPPK
jgi:predicted nucleic acid-binding protein